MRTFASKIADAAAGKPILDVACGSGRNAMLLAQRKDERKEIIVEIAGEVEKRREHERRKKVVSGPGPVHSPSFLERRAIARGH